MANPRTPVAKAKALGAAIKNPKRHADRADPAGKPLGAPSTMLTGDALTAWEGFKRELPWLMESDRTLVEIVSILRGRMIASPQDVGIQALSTLQSCLSKLGATPSDRSKISHGEPEPEIDEFFGTN